MSAPSDLNELTDPSLESFYEENLMKSSFNVGDPFEFTDENYQFFNSNIDENADEELQEEHNINKIASDVSELCLSELTNEFIEQCKSIDENTVDSETKNQSDSEKLSRLGEEHVREEEKEIRMNPFMKYLETPSLLELRTAALNEKFCKRLPYMLVKEVVVHNKRDDCWVIILGLIQDLTPLIEEYTNGPEAELVKPIIAFAGKDISHWFNKRTGDIKHFVHPVTGVLVPYTPHGRIPHVSLEPPISHWAAAPKLPWWMDPKYTVAKLTANERPIRILNMLTGLEVQINVCAEDTINRIRERYSLFNAHALSYAWKFETRLLDMEKTLDGNRIYDEKQMFTSLGLSENFYVPCLMLYYLDDLTED